MPKKKVPKESEPSLDLLCQNLSQATFVDILSDKQRQLINKINNNLDNISKDEAIPECVLLLHPIWIKEIVKKLSITAKQKKKRWKILVNLLYSYKLRVLGKNFTFEVDSNSIWSNVKYEEEVKDEDTKPLQNEKAEDLACDVLLSKFYAENKNGWKEKDLVRGFRLLIQFKAQTDFVKYDRKHLGVLNVLLQYGVYTSITTKSLHDALWYGLGMFDGDQNYKDDADKDTNTLNHGLGPKRSIAEHSGFNGPVATTDDCIRREQFEPLETLLQLGRVLCHSRYPGVNPFILDSNGNNLLTKVALCPLSKQSLYAVKILCNYDIDAFRKNLEGKHALDYLKSDDPRYLVIRGATVASTELAGVIQRLERIISSLDESKFKEAVIQWELKTSKQKSKTKNESLDVLTPKTEISNFDRNVDVGLELQEDDEMYKWEVEITQDVWKLLQNKKVIGDDMKRRFFEKTRWLAKGECRNEKRLSANTCKDMDLYEIDLDRGARILWEMPVTYSAKMRVYSEVIRIWDIVLDHSKLDRSIKRVKISYKRGMHSNFKVKVWKRIVTFDEKGKYPETFSKRCYADSRDFEVAPPASYNKNDYHTMKFYDLPLDHEDFETLPFKPTEEEHTIIEMTPCPPQPIILLGRSGTGKTICCLYRLWEHYQNRRAIEEEQNQEHDFLQAETSGGRLKQLYVTKNAVLCAEVKKHFTGIKTSLTGNNRNRPFDDNLPLRFQDADEGDFPLFLSSKNLIKILDASLPFLKRNEDSRLQEEIRDWASKDVSASIFEEVDNDESEDELYEDHRKGETNTGPITNFNARQEVTHDVFKAYFWPKIKNKVPDTKSKLNPSLVWTEIRTYLKGSYEALCTDNGYLDEETYMGLGWKRTTISEENRKDVYRYFEEYQARKFKDGYFDECDFIFHVYKRLIQRTDKDWKIHEIYVDETQDFTQAELWLLLHVCEDPNNMFLTGDTAQSIMRGIAFRFKDLTSLFHHANEDAKRNEKAIVTVPKEMLQLTYNYRSHSGILDISSSVIALMQELFPYSFDQLERDIGFMAGPKPRLVSDADLEDLKLKFGIKDDKSPTIEFGTEQVVLVADDKAKEDIPQHYFGQVLTIYEAKGLEFNDVLLYNFFRDSQATNNEWNVVENYKYTPRERHEQSLVKIEVKTNRQNESDPNQHTIMISELKHLYTALTRARVNIFIFEKNWDHPMLRYFLEGGVLQLGTDPGYYLSSDELEKRGDKYYRKHIYASAIKCYQICGQKDKKEKAFIMERIQETMSGLKGEKKTIELLLASEECFQKGMLIQAKKTIELAKELYLQAKMYEKLGKFDKALEIYEEKSYPKSASKIYEEMLDFKKALDVLETSEIYEEALNLIMRFKIKLKEPGIESSLRSSVDFTKVLQIRQLNLEKRREQDRVSYIDIDNFMSSYREKKEQQQLRTMEKLEKTEKEVNMLKEPLRDEYCTKCSMAISTLLHFQSLREFVQETSQILNAQNMGTILARAKELLFRGIQENDASFINTALEVFKTEKSVLGVLECLFTLDKRFSQTPAITNMHDIFNTLGTKLKDMENQEYLNFYCMENNGHSIWSCNSQTNECLHRLWKTPEITRGQFLINVKNHVKTRARCLIEEYAERCKNYLDGSNYIDVVKQMSMFLRAGMGSRILLSKVKETLLPPSGHSADSFPSQKHAKEVSKILNKSNSLDHFSNHAKEIWHTTPFIAKSVDFLMDVYQDLTLGRGNSKEFCKMLSELENACNKKNNFESTAGFFRAEKSGWNYSIFWIYILALNELHENSSPTEALKLLAFFLSYPKSYLSIAHYMELMELMLVLASSLYSCCLTPDYRVFLPESYLCNVHFWDRVTALTSINKHQTLFQSVKTFAENKRVDTVELDVIMDQMTRLVVGDNEQNLGVLQRVFSDAVYMQNGECKNRVLRMALVMMCNVGNGMFSDEDGLHIKKCLSSSVLSEAKVDIPANVKKDFENTQIGSKPTAILSYLLKEKGEQSRSYYWDREKLCPVEKGIEGNNPNRRQAKKNDEKQHKHYAAMLKENVIQKIKDKKKKQGPELQHFYNDFLGKEKRNAETEEPDADILEKVQQRFEHKAPKRNKKLTRCISALKSFIFGVLWLIVYLVFHCLVNPGLQYLSTFGKKDDRNKSKRKSLRKESSFRKVAAAILIECVPDRVANLCFRRDDMTNT